MRDDQDATGRAMLAYLRGDDASEIIERDDNPFPPLRKGG